MIISRQKDKRLKCLFFIKLKVFSNHHNFPLLGGFGGTAGSSKMVADVLGFPESLHHHGVHGREVGLNIIFDEVKC